MIPGLDGLRALAFLAVFLFHSGYLPFGWVGVQFFFVLSGFLITNILLKMKETFAAKDYFYKFYGRRFLRIFPLYYLYLFLMTIVFVFLPVKGFLSTETNEMFRKQIGFAFGYVYDFFHASAGFQLNRFFSHLWSLSVEEQFYIVWPLLILLVPRNKFKTLCLVAIGIGPVARLVTLVIYRQHVFPFLLDNPALAVYVLPFSYLDAFAIGAYISQYEIRQPRLKLLILLLFIPLAGMACDYISTGTLSLSSLGYSMPLTNGYKEIWGYSLLNCLFASITYCAAKTRLFSRILDTKILQYLGKISYGLYIYHNILIAFIIVLFIKLKWNFPLQTPVILLTTLTCTILVAVASYHIFEKPITQIKEKLFTVSHS
jgi:peptidoglycan/LPS O-acetylase OafA/YrhL